MMLFLDPSQKLAYGRKITPQTMTEEKEICLIGDSVLDNFYWLADPSKDLRAVLSSKGYKTRNYAVDEAQLRDLSDGQVPAEPYVKSRQYPYSTAEDGKVHPLRKIAKYPGSTVVMSVVGNDLRVAMPKIIFGPSYFVDSVLTAKYRKEYEHVVGKIIKHHKLILIMPYMPYTGSGIYVMLSPLADLIYDRIREFIYSVGQKYGLPVIDLSRTFDRGNRSHYGSTEIEPSNLTCEVIADGIDLIVKSGHKVGPWYQKNCVGKWKNRKFEEKQERSTPSK